MGKIILAQYLIDCGLTQEIFCNAFKFSLNELQDTILEIRVVKKKKPKGVLSKIMLFGDGFFPGIDLGFYCYSESAIHQVISEMKAISSAPHSRYKIKCAVPKKKSFLQWFNKKLNKIKKRHQARITQQQQAEERKKHIVPISLQLIKSFQQQILAHGNLLEENYNFLLSHGQFLKEHCCEKFTAFKKALDAVTEFAETQFNDINDIKAIETKKTICILDSDNKAIFTIKLPDKHIDNRIDRIISYHGVDFDIDYIRTFKIQISDIVTKIERNILEENLKKFLSEIPEELDSAIKNLQKQFENHWDKTLTMAIGEIGGFDTEFLEEYGRKNFINFQRLATKIKTEEELEKWIHSWIERANKYLSGPSLLTTAVITILQLVKKSPKYGIRTYAMWLGSSKAKTLLTKNLDQSFQHKLQNYTIEQIARQIENIIDYDWLEINRIGRHDLPVLELTKQGREILTKKEKEILTEEEKMLPEKTERVPMQQPDTALPVSQQAAAIELYPYTYLLEKIKSKDRTAWVEFLNSSQNVAQIAYWDQGQIEEICQTLDTIMAGWKTLTKWKLIKHPIKYKVLERLL